eukprot:scaffold49642_cov63-Phaeocystis_antarctica.AAC.3
MSTRGQGGQNDLALALALALALTLTPTPNPNPNPNPTQGGRRLLPQPTAAGGGPRPAGLRDAPLLRWRRLCGLPPHAGGG